MSCRKKFFICMMAFARNSPRFLTLGQAIREHSANIDVPLPSMPPPAPLDRPALISALRARIARMERIGAAEALAARGEDAVPLNTTIDSALPWGGLPRASLHEILAAEPGAAAGFAALLLARAGGTVLWIAAEPDAWPPGLARFGLTPDRLVLVQAPREADALWAMEETLRCPAVGAALLVAGELDLTAARRLQLAAEAGGVLGLLLRPDTDGAAPTAALTRWRIDAAPSDSASRHEFGDPAWSLHLLRCRGGRGGAWRATWHEGQASLVTEGGSARSAPARRRA
jgi:protein ImuA